MNGQVELRETEQGDLPEFFEHQQDPVANVMAMFPPRERAAFMTHWSQMLADDQVVKRTILFQNQVAGSVIAFSGRANGSSVTGWEDRFGGKASPLEPLPRSSPQSRQGRCMLTSRSKTWLPSAYSRSVALPSREKAVRRPRLAGRSSMSTSTRYTSDSAFRQRLRRAAQQLAERSSCVCTHSLKDETRMKPGRSAGVFKEFRDAKA